MTPLESMTRTKMTAREAIEMLSKAVHIEYTVNSQGEHTTKAIDGKVTRVHVNAPNGLIFIGTERIPIPFDRIISFYQHQPMSDQVGMKEK